MKLHLSEQMLMRWLVAGAAIVFVILPFHATLTVWLASFMGHYVGVRLWKEWLLILLVIGAAIVVLRDSALRKRLLCSLLARLIAVYLAVQLVWGIAAIPLHHVVWQALAYGWISDTRYLVFFLTVWVISTKTSWLYTHWKALILWPAVIVVVFGLLQYFILPYNVMTHFGYNSATIFPYEDINHNVQYLRVMSSLRGANPLGAYLIAILSLWFTIIIRARRRIREEAIGPVIGFTSFGVSGVVVLILTFSRSAWIGLIISVVTLIWASLVGDRIRRAILVSVMSVVILAAIVGYTLRDNTIFQNVFFHTQVNSAVQTTSNEGHIAGLKYGARDILHAPLGLGPGTAGPASVYNTGHPVRIAENYFIQITQETGVIGLGLFVAIQGVLVRELWLRRRDTLALGLLAGFVGVSFVGLLSHVWADDTLAYVWWGFAAVACGHVAEAKMRRLKTVSAD